MAQSPPQINLSSTEGVTRSVLNLELRHCAAVLCAAFLNPGIFAPPGFLLLD